MSIDEVAAGYGKGISDDAEDGAREEVDVAKALGRNDAKSGQDDNWDGEGVDDNLDGAEHGGGEDSRYISPPNGQAPRLVKKPVIHTLAN